MLVLRASAAAMPGPLVESVFDDPRYADLHQEYYRGRLQDRRAHRAAADAAHPEHCVRDRLSEVTQPTLLSVASRIGSSIRSTRQVGQLLSRGCVRTPPRCGQPQIESPARHRPSSSSSQPPSLWRPCRRPGPGLEGLHELPLRPAAARRSAAGPAGRRCRLRCLRPAPGHPRRSRHGPQCSGRRRRPGSALAAPASAAITTLTVRWLRLPGRDAASYEDFWRRTGSRISSSTTSPGRAASLYLALSSGTTTGVPSTCRCRANGRVEPAAGRRRRAVPGRHLARHCSPVGCSSWRQHRPAAVAGRRGSRGAEWIAARKCRSSAPTRSRRRLHWLATGRKAGGPGAGAGQRITLVGGVPSWLLVLFERLLARRGTCRRRLALAEAGRPRHPVRSVPRSVCPPDRQRCRVPQRVPGIGGFVATETMARVLLRLVPDHGVFFEFVPVRTHRRPSQTPHGRGDRAGRRVCRDADDVRRAVVPSWATRSVPSAIPRCCGFTGRTRTFCPRSAST
jgi:hypothetical protein